MRSSTTTVYSIIIRYNNIWCSLWLLLLFFSPSATPYYYLMMRGGGEENDRSSDVVVIIINNYFFFVHHIAALLSDAFWAQSIYLHGGWMESAIVPTFSSKVTLNHPSS